MNNLNIAEFSLIMHDYAKKINFNNVWQNLLYNILK